MKYTIFFCLLFLSLSAIAQNVGIGITIPSEKLEVAGNVKGTGIIAVNSFQLINGAAVNTVMACNASGNGAWANPKSLPGTIALTAMLAGPINVAPAAVSTYEFFGPTTTINLTANQRVVITFTAELGRSAAGSTAFDLDAGYQLTGGGTLINASGTNYISEFPVFVANEKRSFTISGNFKPGVAGNYTIGGIIRCATASYLNSNDWFNGTYMIINE